MINDLADLRTSGLLRRVETVFAEDVSVLANSASVDPETIRGEEDVALNAPGEGSQKPDILHERHIYGTFLFLFSLHEGAKTMM